MPPRAAGRARVVLLAALLGLVGTACSAFTPTTAPATPTDFAGIVAEMASVGIDVNRVVSGDAGFDARGGDQTTPVRVHLYAFKDQHVYDELRPAVDECARSHVTDAAAFGSVNEPPYVLADNGPWTPAFRDALRTALKRASVGG